MLGLAAAGLVLTACGDDGGDDTAAAVGGGGDEVTELKFGVSTVSIGPAQSTYSSIPVACGFWEEEGLDVEVLGFAGSGATAQALDAGQIDAGISASPSVIGAVAAGADLMSFYNNVTAGYLVPGVVEDSPIQTVEDFAGKTIGVQSLESATVPYIRAMMADAGLEADAAEFVVIGTGAQAASFIKNGAVDVVGLWDSPRAELEELGIPLRVVATDKFEELGFQYPVVATADDLEAQREVMVGIGRGIAKASAYADENPEAAVKLTWQLYPESKPTGVSDEEALAQGVRVFETRNANSQPVDGVWGATSIDDVQSQIEGLVAAGVLQSDVAVEDIWTDELIEEINDFDEEAVREAASSFDGTEC